MNRNDYIFYDVTTSLCSQCLSRIDAKIVFENENVYMLKRCPDHGNEKVLVATDIQYYKMSRNYMKKSQYTRQANTQTLRGCPHDCGICPDHEQHSCVSVIEVTDRCNLKCPTCYAVSGPDQGRHRTLAEIEKMLDVVVANEGEPDVVQISGGEPTIHPDFFGILDMAKRKPIKHLMVNTNGVRIAGDLEFARRLSEYKPGFEVYLQFDSFAKETLESLRGRDLRKVREKALSHLNEFGISTTLVVTLNKRMNLKEVGKIVDYASSIGCVRGVTFQPTQAAGRIDGFDPATDRVTVTEVRQAILDQSSVFRPEDLLPVPCHPEAITMGYALKTPSGMMPLSTLVDPSRLVQAAANTVVFEKDPALQDAFFKLFSTGNPVDRAAPDLKTLLCCLPQIDVPDLSYSNIFRVIIMQFYDAYNFDIRPIKKTCIHVAHPDGRMIPFDTMNILYRSDAR